MKITKDTDYAIRALTCAAASDKGIVTVKELAEELGIPRPFLRKIFQVLNREGILKSFKGKSGGFSLCYAPEIITVFRLVEIFQGPFKLSDHSFRGKVCPKVKICFLKKRLDSLEKTVIKGLKGITIGQLVVKEKENGKKARNNYKQ